MGGVQGDSSTSTASQKNPSNGSPSSSSSSSPATAAENTGIWFEGGQTEVVAVSKNGKYSFKAYIEKAIKGSPTLTISKTKTPSNKFSDTYNIELKEIDTVEPKKGELQDIEIPSDFVNKLVDDGDGKKVYLNKIEYLNEELNPEKTIDLSSRGLIVKIPK